MIKRIGLLMVAALMAAMMMVATAAPAFAASPSETNCEADGGIFNRDGGKVSCTKVDEGKPHPRDKFESIEEESSNGTLNNRPQHEEKQECTDTGSGKCPGGQFK